MGAIASLGGTLGMRVTAEGVETEAQLATVRAQGCTDAQGFLLGHPASAADLPAVIAAFAARAGAP